MASGDSIDIDSAACNAAVGLRGRGDVIALGEQRPGQHGPDQRHLPLNAEFGRLPVRGAGVIDGGGGIGVGQGDSGGGGQQHDAGDARAARC